MDKVIKVAGASGYWGESAMATPQLLKVPDLDYLVYDYLAEITMSIMARAKAKDPKKGYATDFVDFVMRPFLGQIAEKGIKVIANAGGVNPQSCAKAVRALIEAQGLSLKVAVITGDDLVQHKDEIAKTGPTDMFADAPFPDPDKIIGINAYLGAFPIAKALDAGADIIITGRCVDSAVTLGACIHEFGWQNDEWDKLASGSLAGHILECGPQATGGNFTDWRDSGDIADIGYPVAEISPDGSFVLTKPDNTSGIVNVGTVSEQMLYEIGDPRAYTLPDVTCDFSDVLITQEALNRVAVSPAKGYPAPTGYKTCLTYADGFRSGSYMTFYGLDATEKAQAYSVAVMKRANRTLRMFNLGEYTHVSSEVIGGGSQMGTPTHSQEAVLKLAVTHPNVRATGIFLKEMAGTGLATAPGLSGFTGVRGKPSPIVKLHSYITPKSDLTVTIDVDGKTETFKDHVNSVPSKLHVVAATPTPVEVSEVKVPLIKLAYGRSGDKGNKANVGIIARRPDYMPYIWSALSEDFIRDVYAHFEPGDIERFYLPGSHSMNILIDAVLGGGGAASIRNDPQAKGYAQILLARDIPVSFAIAETL